MGPVVGITVGGDSLRFPNNNPEKNKIHTEGNLCFVPNSTNVVPYSHPLCSRS